MDEQIIPRNARSTATYAAIHVHFVGPTNYRPSRVIATSQARPPLHRLVRSWDHALNSSDNYRSAAEDLALALGWIKNPDDLIGGVLPDGSYAFVIDPR